MFLGGRECGVAKLEPHPLHGQPESVGRKAGERTVSGLWSLIGKLVDLFQPQECANYFSSCGYDPD